MKPSKFIIYGNEILLGRVNFHKDLLPEGYNIGIVRGGGLFILNHEDRTIKLYGESFDFGPFNPDVIPNCFLPNKLKDYKVIYV